MTPERLSATVRVLRWLSGELAAEHHALAHVPAQLASALLEEPAAGECRTCGGPMPPPSRTGRPRSMCLSCSPARGKVAEKSTVTTYPNQGE
ncbi:hypothetical protein GCM10027053_03900 [Intrasporangium mesophilum]